MNRPFGFGWIWALGTLVIASIVGVVAFIAGHATEAVTTNPDAARVVNDGYYYGHGFFGFFGFLWFALSVILIFALIRWTIGWRRSPVPAWTPVPPRRPWTRTACKRRLGSARHPSSGP